MNDFEKEFEDKEFVDEEALEAEEQERQKLLEKKKIILPHTVKLNFPFKFGSEMVSEIVFERRLIAKDLMSFPAQDQRFGHMVKIVGKMTGQPTKKLELIDGSDLKRLFAVVENFF